MIGLCVSVGASYITVAETLSAKMRQEQLGLMSFKFYYGKYIAERKKESAPLEKCAESDLEKGYSSVLIFISHIYECDPVVRSSAETSCRMESALSPVDGIRKWFTHLCLIIFLRGQEHLH